jgi:sugar phosphate isomerase/epimerase
MNLSLSGRILQGGAPPMSTADFILLARDTGFDMVELRSDQVPVDSTDADLEALGQVLAEAKIGVSMIVVGDAAQADRWVRVARALGAVNLRVSGTAEALSAAAEALPADLRLVFQMHSGSQFENVALAAETLGRIPCERFGVMPEPANLLFAGETWSADLFAPLKGRIYGCNAQSIALDPASDAAVVMNDGRRVPYSRLDWAANTDLGFAAFIRALRAVGYDGFINFIDPFHPGMTVHDLAAGAAAYARQCLTEA